MSIVMERVLLMAAESHSFPRPLLLPGLCLRNFSGQMDEAERSHNYCYVNGETAIPSPELARRGASDREAGQLIFTLCVCAATLHKNG